VILRGKACDRGRAHGDGGLFADARTHPCQSTAWLLRIPLRALGMWAAQRSPRVFTALMMQVRVYFRSYRPTPETLADLPSAITRRDGAALLHNAPGFVNQQRAAPRTK
jgi:hypothetical protein